MQLSTSMSHHYPENELEAEMLLTQKIMYFAEVTTQIYVFYTDYKSSSSQNSFLVILFWIETIFLTTNYFPNTILPPPLNPV